LHDALIVSLLSAVPKNLVAGWMGRGARLRLPAFLHRLVVRSFVRAYRIDLSESVGEVDDFASLSEFFVRALRPGVRPIDDDPDHLVSPVDAHVHTIGALVGEDFEQAPGRMCSVEQLLGVTGHGPRGICEGMNLVGGSYAILYLAPKDYHRVHVPREGTVAGYRYIPGQLWPVFPAATRRVQGVFARNERLIFRIDTALGPILVVMVGAFGVGRMTTPLADLVTNTDRHPEQVALHPPVQVARGAELGRFELGSTVILLAEPGRLDWLVTPGEDVRLGRPVARAQGG